MTAAHVPGCDSTGCQSATDEQIDALWRAACSGERGQGIRDAEPDIMHLCTVAVNRHGDFTRLEQKTARDRCTDILNVTDDQLRHLRETQSPITGNVAYLCGIALGEHHYAELSRLDARARCALIIHVRNRGLGGGS